jgi:hypothetical protein
VRISPISLLEYSYSFLLLPKMMTATSTEHRTESSCAFLNKPPLRLRNVLRAEVSSDPQPTRKKPYTERFRSSLMALISIFLRPMAATRRCWGGRNWSPNCSRVANTPSSQRRLEGCRRCSYSARAGGLHIDRGRDVGRKRARTTS